MGSGSECCSCSRTFEWSTLKESRPAGSKPAGRLKIIENLPHQRQRCKPNEAEQKCFSCGRAFNMARRRCCLEECLRSRDADWKIGGRLKICTTALQRCISYRMGSAQFSR